MIGQFSLAKARIGLMNPRLAIRKLFRRPLIEIDVAEIGRHIPDPAVVVEAGAFDGADTLRLSAQWPNATVHAFEPVPAAFEVLRKRTGKLPNIRVHRAALASSSGDTVMYVSDSKAQQRTDSSSLLVPTGHLRHVPNVKFDDQIQVASVNLDDWLRHEGIDRVDLLWLDLQGLELSVLMSAPLTMQGVSAVCMEVSRKELFAGSALYPDVVPWMRGQGFEVAIDRVNHLFGNMLFVRRRRQVRNSLA